ncbi:MAG: hypothetical protein QF918_10725 [Pirellulaceae bacterium]|nr:hypothetical protein [Pirellulaceae bacterium]
MSDMPRILVAVQLIVCLCGCASWDSPSAAVSFDLPSPRMSPDSVVLEIAFLRVPVDSAAEFATLWNEVDEQQLSNEDRRRLQSNGFRVGVIGPRLPDMLRQLLDKAESPFEATGSSGVLSEDIFQNRRRLPVRAGQPAKIVAVPKEQEQIAVLQNEGGYVRGVEFKRAQGVFVLRAFPLGDGRVRIQLTPTIEHGLMRNQYVGGDQSFMLQAGRDTHEFEDLRLESLLSPGQTLAVTKTLDAKGLGSHFFAADAAASSSGSVMLIRLAQTQLDDLFSSDLEMVTTDLEFD